MFGRNKIAMVVAEFLGTFALVSAVLAMIGRTNFPFFSATAAGATFGLLTLVMATATSVHLNPALTVGMWTLRQVGTIQAIVAIAAQVLGGVVAWTLSEYLLNQSLRNIANTSFDWRVLVAEGVGALFLSLGVTAALLQGLVGLRRAFVLGGSVSVGMILASFGSNGLVNPAVALGVQSWSFAYAAGPVLGAIIGANLYALLFAGQSLNLRPRAARVTTTSSTAKPRAKRTTTRRKR